MKDARVWVGAAVALALAAGTAIGLAVADVRASATARFDEGLSAADQEFLARFRSDFSLSERQTVLLQAILRKRNLDETEIYRRNFTEFPQPVQDQIATVRRAADKRIEHILEGEQRDRYERLRGTAEAGEGK